MAVEEWRHRLNQALDSVEPSRALHELAHCLKSEGVRQKEMYQLFADSFIDIAGDDPRYHAMADTMDMIWGGGWAKGHALFGTDPQDGNAT